MLASASAPQRNEGAPHPSALPSAARAHRTSAFLRKIEPTMLPRPPALLQTSRCSSELSAGMSTKSNLSPQRGLVSFSSVVLCCGWRGLVAGARAQGGRERAGGGARLGVWQGCVPVPAHAHTQASSTSPAPCATTTASHLRLVLLLVADQHAHVDGQVLGGLGRKVDAAHQLHSQHALVCVCVCVGGRLRGRGSGSAWGSAWPARIPYRAGRGLGGRHWPATGMCRRGYGERQEQEQLGMVAGGALRPQTVIQCLAV